MYKITNFYTRDMRFDQCGDSAKHPPIRLLHNMMQGGAFFSFSRKESYTKRATAIVEGDNGLTAIICPRVCISKKSRESAYIESVESDDSKHKLVVAGLIYPNMMNGLLYPRT